MSLLGMWIKDDKNGTETIPRWQDQINKANQRDTRIQFYISVGFGLSAFLSFCVSVLNCFGFGSDTLGQVLRPRWTELYNARKKRSAAATRLPELPKSLFGWIPVVYNISRAEILASAGLDAYAFLSFFRYAIKYLCITLFFSLTVILPVNNKYIDDCWFCLPANGTGDGDGDAAFGAQFKGGADDGNPKLPKDLSYLWMHVIFAYFFTGVALYLLVQETKDMIRIRQAYLGTQFTITDRTIRLSGIPEEMRDEERITSFIEGLGIGKVDSVMLCRNWRKLDDLMTERMACLRKLEGAWAKYLGHHHSLRHTRDAASHRTHRSGTDRDDAEATALLSHSELEQEHEALKDRKRPIHTIRYGSLGLKTKKIDAIDYYEEKLRRYDGQIHTLRNEEFQTTALAFVTMKSVSACQMAVQAILDPNPGQLIASLAPPPVDVVWSNTYLSRNTRMARSWGIMIVIGFLTIFWAVLLLPLAGLLSIEAIDKVLPGLADTLNAHPVARSLFQTGLPTLVFSLLSIAIPYLYDWLANQQGMTSQGDIELSVISKNFFFTFFNLFIVFTIWGSAATFYEFWKELQDLLKDTAGIAFAVASSLASLAPFYRNLIILQGLGLFPFRLLEFGSVALYPVYLISAKTPRDHADLAKPPVFSYGFYLPQTMLIFVICIVYSVFDQRSWTIIAFGLVYFLIGGFIYKYQLLYAMDHREHSTGRGWPMICNRIIMGFIIFQIAMAGLLTLRGALSQAALITPLVVATVWFTLHFQRSYFPLMRFIALKSIEDKDQSPIMPTPHVSPFDRATDHGRAVEFYPEDHVRYINPNLISPLEALWIRKPGHEQSGRDA